MPNLINQILLEFIQKVKDLLGERFKKAILYGSYARGDYNKSSDVDVMILTDLDFKEIEDYRDMISDIAFDIELKNGIVISPVVKNIDIYNSRIEVVPFYSNVQKEGVLIDG